MTWNWLGYLLWITGIIFLCLIIHFIRVKQLMLIAKTKRRFSSKLFGQYVGLLIIAFFWLGGMIYFTFLRVVPTTNTKQLTASAIYEPLQLTFDKGGNYFYVQAERSNGGDHPIVSYTYWTSNAKKTTSARSVSIADGDNYITAAATSYPWDRQKLAHEDASTGHAFAATITMRYKNTLLNGLGIHSGHIADQHTLIRIPVANMITTK